MMGADYTFNVEDVKVNRKAIAPYSNGDGMPKDWQEATVANTGTRPPPSNLWADITIPIWSMPRTPTTQLRGARS